ncbi:MAG TPA: tetratricopeptide repeat protein [Polyangiaceae bacterium]|nr:tetratricopeptide repeat protein [Polyangiaceae bacterium]
MGKDNVTFGLVSGSRASFIGRTKELAALDLALEDVEKRRETRVVTVVGPQGVGKSRLVHEFILSHRAGSALIPRVYRGSARDTDAAYGLFARLLRMRFGLVEGMDAEAIKAEVRAQVSKVTGDRKVGDIAYFLGQFLEVPFEESPLTKAVADDPAQGRLLRRAVFKSFIEADAAHSPICLVFDDLHAAHADSLDLLRYLVEYVSGPVLILCASRPELLSAAEDWPLPGSQVTESGRARHVLVELDALSDADSRVLMRSMLAPCADAEGHVPEALVDNATAFAAGNPSLLEQMVRLYHDRGVLEEEAALSDEPKWKVHLDRLEQAELPLTVEDAIGARLAALKPFERKVLELAATMGSVFWTAGIVPLLRTGVEAPDLWRADDKADETRVAEALADLERRDYVLRLPDSTLEGSDEYAFKHNKEREAIAARTSATAEKRHHGVFADWLARQMHLATSEETLALLADHRERSGDHIGAGLAYLEAGDVARAAYAAAAACSHYEKGLELLGDEHALRRIDALHNYGDVLALAGRIDDALAAFREMLSLAYRLDIRSKGGAAHNRIGRLYRDTGALEDAGKHLEAAMALFVAAEDERGIASSIDDLGKLSWLKGDYRAALTSLREGLTRRRRLGDRRSIALSLNNLGIVLQETGEFGQAIESWEQALGIRRDIGDLVGVVATLNNLGTLFMDRGDFPRARALFEDALEVAKQIGDRNRIALVLVNVGDSLHRSGEPDRAIEVLKQAEEQFDELGDKLGLADALRALGEAHLARGDLVKARDCIGRCVDIFATVRSRVQLGVALRTLGEITAAGGWGPTHTKSAREYFARSAGIFEQTGNEIELARTFTAFAKFLRAEEELAKDPAAIAEAHRMEQASQAIFARLLHGLDARPRAQSSPVDPE